MTLPILLSVPHAGTRMPEEVRDLSVVSREDVLRDGDEQAGEIYYPLQDRVAHFTTTEIARAFVDLNRAPGDLRGDGVVKTHTCWEVPIYRSPLTGDLVERLLDLYYHPYHRRLTGIAEEFYREPANGTPGAETGARSVRNQVRSIHAAVDAHTMLAVGPPIGPGAGLPRPRACVSNGDGTCPDEWMNLLAELLGEALQGEVGINEPFRGGYIIRTHAAEMPWLQLEISRGDFLSLEVKRDAVAEALDDWCSRLFG